MNFHISLRKIQTHHTDNLAELLVTTMEVIYAFGVLLITSELGQRMNAAFVECSQMVTQFDWHLFPADIQRMLPTIIHFTQQSIEIKCFGNVACDRDTFKSVSILVKHIACI